MKGVVLFCTLVLSMGLFGQGLRTQGKTIVDSEGNEVILRGMGLGGWMVQEGYMMQSGDVANTQHRFRERATELIGEENTADFYERWLANHVTKRDIDSLKSWGFNSVRAPMHYNLFTLPIEEEPVLGEQTWLTTGFDLLDNLLSWCESNEMYLILDLHAAPGGQGYDEAISDYDPSKPSLWESVHNRVKTIALWRKLAERYAGEEWIGGYDLLNETNWNLNNGQELRALYGQITSSIREVDQDHIIFIEGNWFANDFTGLTPPWDSNMVYSFHKYWSFNDQGSIQWVLDLREAHNVPLWMGEAGENSNTWFTDAIHLFESNGIGWAWWPMKKIETINSPFSIEFSEGYKNILRYWRGEIAKPTVEEAVTALTELTDNLLIENTDYRRDVPDAMIRQPHTDETIPYGSTTLPGIVYMSEYDLGKNGFAYFDEDVANYSLSTGQFTAWNAGWSFRNDGADVEANSDNVNSNGFHLGFVKEGEWTNYTVQVEETAAYTIKLRVASEESGGKLLLKLDGQDILSGVLLDATGGWTNFTTVQLQNVLLEEGMHTLTFASGGTKPFNISSIEFINSGSYESVEFVGVESYTGDDEKSIRLILNKPIAVSSINEVSGMFTVKVNDQTRSVVSVDLEADRTISLTLAGDIHANDDIRLSYSGTAIKSTLDETLLPFSNMIVNNTLVFRHFVPTRIEAEEFAVNMGLGLETTSDVGGGLNIGFTDSGDYADYLIDVAEAGEYILNLRVASQSSIGVIGFYLVDDGEENLLVTKTTPVTNGWQEWRTVSTSIELPEGEHILRMKVQTGGFNLNWFEIEVVLAVEKTLNERIEVYPIPASTILHLNSAGFSNYLLMSTSGQVLKRGVISRNQIDISTVKSGIYILKLTGERSTIPQSVRVIIQR